MYKIFIVEDDMGIAEAIKKQAEMWELQAKYTENFRDVINDFLEYNPHLVLLDISLPFFNGYHWCMKYAKFQRCL